MCVCTGRGGGGIYLCFKCLWLGIGIFQSEKCSVLDSCVKHENCQVTCETVHHKQTDMLVY